MVIPELFVTILPQAALTAADVVAPVHRASLATALSEEDREQDPEHWCSPAACGPDVWPSRTTLTLYLPQWPCRSSKLASASATLCSRPMARCVVLPGGCCIQPQSATRLAAACDWSLPSKAVTVAPASSVSGVAAIPGSRARSARCPSPEMTGVAGSIVEAVERSGAINGLRCTCILPISLSTLHLLPFLPVRCAHAQLSWHERIARNQASATAGQCTITLFGMPERVATSSGLLSAERCGWPQLGSPSSGRPSTQR